MKKNRTKKRIKVRRVWNINPKTRVKEDKKIYKRPKSKRDLKNIVKETL